MSNATSLPAVIGAGAAGVDELAGGLRNWRVWHLIGVRELRHRYARSRLGQLWLTLSTAIMIVGMGAVWSLLWDLPLRELMPFFGIGLIMWQFLSNVLTDCTSILVAHSHIYRNQKMNFSVSIYSVIYRNIVVLAHNLIIALILIVTFGVPVNWYTLQIVPALALTLITLAWLGYLIAIACLRYRDLIQLVANWVQVMFFLTPVLWKPELLPARYHFIIDFNPLAQLLELLRTPLLGQPVSAWTWCAMALIAFGGGLVALPAIGRYQRRVIFWM
jgi:ABC-type polysaccharide/polyol phosphate export permease